MTSKKKRRVDQVSSNELNNCRCQLSLLSFTWLIHEMYCRHLCKQSKVMTEIWSRCEITLLLTFTDSHATIPSIKLSDTPGAHVGCLFKVKVLTVKFGSTLQSLIDQGANVNMRDEYLYTPLLEASRSGHVSIIEVCRTLVSPRSCSVC